ncbi:hypothetical protein COO55_18905 [Rhodococcus opacus]|nr:hypothetical protein COO55_18905 [Rhodococcus opacus]
MADYLDTVADRLHRGEHVSGPAARRLISAATGAQLRFEGMYLTPNQATALLAVPQFHVYDNPESVPHLQLRSSQSALPPRPHPPGRSKSPAVDRCDPACANIARTDTHIAALRSEIARLRKEVVEPATPMPLRERLGQRVAHLDTLVEQHERTRITSREETDVDR